jgi:hypothetical protein
VSSTGWLGINCPEPKCGAIIDEPCHNLVNGAPLNRRPAHERRLWNAEALGLWEPSPYVDHGGDDPWAVSA